MKKVLLVTAIVLLLSLSMVSALHVDCSQHRWWTSHVCQDWELQDEFDIVTDMIDDNTQGINDIDYNVSELTDFVSVHSEIWSRDVHGGLKTTSLASKLTGDKYWFQKYNIPFLSFLDMRYATVKSVTMANERMDRLEAMILILAKGEKLYPTYVAQVAAKIKIDRLGLKNLTMTNTHCYSDMCLSVN